MHAPDENQPCHFTSYEKGIVLMSLKMCSFKLDIKSLVCEWISLYRYSPIQKIEGWGFLKL